MRFYRNKKFWVIISAVIAFCVLVDVSAFIYSYRHPKPYDLYVKSSAFGFIRYEQSILYKERWVPSWVRLPIPHSLEDYCYVGDPSKPSQRGDNLKEYTSDKGLLSFGDRTCDCSDGACFKPAQDISVCIETDNGSDIYTRGTITGIAPMGTEPEGFISLFTDECSAGMLLEGFCYANSKLYDYNWTSCQFGCHDGRCLKEENSIVPPDYPKNVCYDSDENTTDQTRTKGTTYGIYVGGEEGVFVTQEDECSTDNQLNEFYCADQTHSSARGVQCKCKDGACFDTREQEEAWFGGE